jgi:hypothetical protein
MNEPLEVEAAPIGDGGVSCPNVAMPTNDMGQSDPLATLDPQFICSKQILLSGTGNYSTRIGGLVNGQSYFFKVLAIDQSGNATPSDLTVGVPVAAQDLYGRYYNLGGRAHGFCFIATAAFGSYENRYVKVLRQFRDEVLLPTGIGRAFVDWYYAHSPPLAAFIAEHRAARIATQLALWPVIALAALWLYTAAWMKLAALALVVLALKRRRTMRRRLRLAAEGALA